MSFLNRRASRPDQRGSGGAGRHNGADYDEYDYAPDYQQNDDNWSPDEYFSPEGIKGRWAAGARPGERQDGRGHRDDGSDDFGPGPQRARGGQPGGYGRDSYQQDSYEEDDSYGDEYGTGGYEVQDGAGDERGGRKRRDRSDRDRRRRLGRRDKTDDIWPDDGVSDEDYWASVAADRPFSSGGPAGDAGPRNPADNRPLAASAGAPRPVSDMRSGSGRLGPAPGLGPAPAGRPGGATGSGPMPGGRPGGGPGSGPMPVARPAASSGPMPTARPGGGPGSGPMPVARPAASSGPMPTARPGGGTGSGPMPATRSGGTGSGPMVRPGTGPNSGPMTRPGGGPNSGPMARPGGGPNSGPMARPGTGQYPARPAAGHGATGQGATGYGATGPGAARPAAGLARPGFGSPTHSQPTVAQPSLSQPAAAQPGFSQPSFSARGPAQPSFQPNTGRGGGRQPALPDWGERTERMDRISAAYPDPRGSARGQSSQSSQSSRPSGPLSAPVSVWGRGDAAEQRLPDVREPGRRGTEDDPLTSARFSREELSRTDGRSYRVASQRAQITTEQYAAALTEQTQTFSVRGSQYQADPQAATGGYPVRGGQQPGSAQPQQPRQSSNPYDRGTASYPYPGQPQPSRPAPADQGEDRYGRPTARPGSHETGYNGNGGYGGRY